MPVLTFQVPADIDEAVSEAARSHMISKSAFLRLFLTEHVKQVKAHRIDTTKPGPRPRKKSGQGAA